MPPSVALEPVAADPRGPPRRDRRDRRDRAVGSDSRPLVLDAIGSRAFDLHCRRRRRLRRSLPCGSPPFALRGVSALARCRPSRASDGGGDAGRGVDGRCRGTDFRLDCP